MASSSPPDSPGQQQGNDLNISENLLRATLDSSMDMMQVFEAVRDDRGEIVDFIWILNNHASEKIYGNVIGKSLLKHQPGVVAEGIFDAFKQVVETGEPQQYEKHYVHEQFNGWFRQSVVKLNGGVATTTSDITSLKNTEEKLRTAKENLQVIFDSSIFFIQAFRAVRDETGKIIDFRWTLTNHKWNQLYGNVTGKSLLEENPGVKETGLFDKFVQVTEKGITVDHEQYYSHEQFEDQWFHQTLVKMGDGFVMNTEDITQRKKNESEILRLKDEAAQNANSKYQKLVTSIYQGFALYELIRDENGLGFDYKILELNPAFKKQTGISMQLQLERTAKEIFPSLDQWWIETFTNLVDSGVPLSFEHYFKEIDRWYEAGAYPIQGDQFAVLYNDITDRKIAEQQQAFLLKFSDALRTEQSVDAVATCAIRLLIAHLGLDRSYITTYYLEKGRAELDYQIGNDSVPPLPDYFILSDYPEAFETTFEKTVVIEDDWERQGLSEEEKRNSRQLGMRAMIGATLRKENKPLWSMVAISSRPRKWTKNEIALLEEVAERTWAAIERAKAEEALRKSEEKYRMLFETMSQGYQENEVIRDENGNAVDHRLVNANPQFERLTGMKLSDCIGKPVKEIMSNTDAHWLELFDRVARTGIPEHCEREYVSMARWYDVDVFSIGGDKVGLLMEDITERKYQERNKAYLLELSDALRLLSDAMRIQDEALRLLRKELNAPRALLAEALDQRGTMRITAESLEEGLFPTKGTTMQLSDFTPRALEEALQGKPLWREDVKDDDLLPKQQAGYAALQTRAWLMVPLVKNGKLLAEVTIHHSQPRVWKPREIQLVRETIDRAWLAVQRARAEQHVRDSEKRLRIATEAADMATWEWDLVKNQVIWNERHFQIFGMEPQAGPVDPMVFFKHIHPVDQERVEGLLRKSLAEDVEFETEFRAVLENGSERWMSGYGRVMERSGDKPVSMSGVMFDITARRRAENDLHRIEERQKAIIESAKDYAILTLDLDLRVRDWNAGAQNMMGYLEEEIVGQPGEIFFVPEDRAKGAPQTEKEKAISEGRAMNERWHLRKDGSRFYGSGVTTPLLDEAGNVIGLLKVMRDLTQQKQGEDALKQASRRKDEFLAMLAHELRNPISTLRNGISILKMTQQADSQTSEIVSMMDNQATHLVRMIDDLLDVSRVTQGKIELKLERLKIDQLITDTVKAIQPQYEARGKTLHISTLSAELFVQGDRTRLSQVITNLLTNGLRYTEDNGEVWVSLTSKNGEAVICVKDNGIGLTPEQQTSVFDLFVQGDNSLARIQGGLGIGLTLVKQLVEMHGGHVDARSPGIGSGSEFRVFLPLLDLPENREKSQKDDLSEARSAMRVLLIDDMEDLAKLTAMLLKLKGFHTDIRTSGKEGAEAVEMLKPPVVLCDIGMPELDGYQTAALIREGAWGRQVKLIALSGYGQHEDKLQAMQAGFDAHLTKPVDIEELQSVIVKLTADGKSWP
ncbi:PAS domain S-box protein [Dyadobacter sp.]|uniref:PAS domain S-box protein n=1 Tax=Dyadobacter sp. TaxID=1914288 RepID=UPI003F724710